MTGIYDNGRRLSQLLRERALDLHHDGMRETGAKTLKDQHCKFRAAAETFIRLDYSSG